MKLVDTQDLKSCLQQCECRFKSGPGHLQNPTNLWDFLFALEEIPIPISGLCSALLHDYCLLPSSLHRNHLFVGMTNDLSRRFQQHQSGKNATTKPYRPFKIIYTEKFALRVEVRRREIYLKSGIGKEFLRSISSL